MDYRLLNYFHNTPRDETSKLVFSVQNIMVSFLKLSFCFFFFKMTDFDFGPLRKSAASFPRRGRDAVLRGRGVWGRNAGLGARGRGGAVSRRRPPPQYRVSASRPGLGSEEHAALAGARALQGLRPPGAPNTRGTAHRASPGRTSHGRVQRRRAGGRAGKGPFGKGWRRPSRSQRVAPRLTGAHPAQGSPFPPTWAGLSSCPREARGGTPDSGGEARGWRARRGPVSATRPPPQRPTRGLPLWGPRPGQHGTRCRPRGRRPQPAVRYSRWLHGSGLRAAGTRARGAGLDPGGLVRAAGHKDGPREGGLGG